MHAFIVIILAALTGVAIALVITPEGRRIMASGFGYVVPYTARAYVEYLPALAGFLARMITRAMTASRGVFLALVAEFAHDITGEKIRLDLSPTGSFQGGLAQFGAQMNRAFGSALQRTLAPAQALEPDQARERINEMLGLSATLQMQNWWAHTILELTSLGALDHLADFSGAIERGFGFNTFGRSIGRRLFTLGIAEPMGVFFNRTYQATRLTTSQAIDAWQKALITDNNVLDILRDNGYRYDRATLLLNLAQREVTVDQAERLWRTGRIDDGKLQQIIRRQGYGEQRADLVADLVTGERTEKLLGEMADTARRAYRNGRMSASELREFLTEAHYRAPEIDLILVREELERQQEKQLSKSEVMEAFREGVLDEFDTRDRLRALSYESEEIDIILATQQKRLSPAQVIDALSRGIIDEAAGRRRLSQLGYRDEDIDLLLDLRTRKLTLGQVIDALSRGLLNVQSAREQLRRLGFESEAIELLLAFQQRELGAGDIQAAVLRGLISEGEALLRLERLGYRREDAVLILSLRFQLLSSGQVLDAYEGGRLTRFDARDRLQVLGFTRDDAELLLARFEDKIIREGKVPPPAS